MEKGEASRDHAERPTSPASTNAWSTMETLRAVSPEPGNSHGETAEWGKSNINEVLNSENEGYELNEIRPTTSATGTSQWPLLPHNNDGSVQTSEHINHENTTTNAWSTSATLDVMPETRDGLEGKDDGEEAKNESSGQTEGEATTETAAAPRKEKKKLSLIKDEHKKSFKHFLRIFSYSSTGDKLLLAAAVFCSICTGVTLPLMNVVFGQLVGAFGAFYNPYSGDTPAKFEHTINQNVLYMVYLFIGRLFLDYVAILGFRMISIRISSNMRLTYMKALFAQPISTLDVLPPGQTAAIITITSNILQLGISEKLSMFVQSVSLVVTALVIAFKYSWRLTLVTSSGLVFISAFYGGTMPFVIKALGNVEHADRMTSAVASEVFSSIRMVAACGAELKMVKKYTAWVEESRRRGLKMGPLVAIQQAPVFFAIHATFALSFWYAIKLYMEFKITSVKTMIIVLMSIMTITMSIGSIATPLSAAARSANAASIFFTIIDHVRPKVSGISAPDVSSSEDIVLENVNFCYPIRPDVKVLDDLSLRFPAGKLTAIVGASGSGKSTIVGLIERWYELDGDFGENLLTLYFRNGTISTGGINLKDIELKWWRSQIGLVQQEPFLFNDTIFKNVQYGLIGTEWEHESEEKKREMVEAACKEAFADEFITRLPDGYDTQCGDAGIKLSGGQRQRLAIARSIIKKPKILILDEATSAIDVRGEKIVQAALDKVSAGRTTITIAHRLSTIMKADNIIVLKKGKVVQQGTHENLLADKEGAYYALANAQKLSMGDEDEKAEGSDRLKGSADFIDFKRNSSIDTLMQTKFSVELEEEKRAEEPEYKMRGFLGSFGSLLWEQKGHWFLYTLMMLSALMAGAAFPIQAFLFAELISVFSYWGLWLEFVTNFWCFWFTMLAIAVGVAYFALGWSANNVSFHITSTYRNEYFANVLRKPVAYYDDEENSVGGLTARMASDPTQLQQLLGINMAFVVISILNVLGCVTISFYFGWKLTLLTVCSSMPIILAAGFFRIRYETQFEKMNHEVFAESSKFATESIGAIRTVTALTLEGEICDRYEKLLQDHVKMAFKKARFSTLVFALSDSIALLCMAFVLWYGGHLLATYEYYPFNYLVVYLAVVQGSVSAGQWLSFGPNIAQASAAANRIRSMRKRGEIEDDGQPLDFDGEEVDEEKGPNGVRIELRNVHFKYPTRDVPVLNGLNMTIEKGQFAAIVGPSGCGKTSIISILERFYKIQSGKVLFHGQDINNIELSSYRSTISLVAQEAAIFSGTIRENIFLGVSEETEDSVLHRACQDAGIHDFIISLPEGYDTEVGSKGIALSGGQKQRLAIARALIRNPRVLLLDEATSNLDSETEKQVQAVFERTGKGRTMIVVAHRLATVQNADVIFVIGDGNVVEQGSHNSLLRKRGLYWQMCQSQALDR